jgi:UDP-N-acetylmuramate dehydrogenase
VDAAGRAGLTVQEDVPLAALSTLGVGGPARFYARAADPDAVEAGVAWAESRALPLFVLGGGSNIVVSDEGYPGLVLHVVPEAIEARRSGGEVHVRAGAGVVWDVLVAHTADNGWAGVECLSGIPGRVGATPIQNVGAYGQDVSETITAVEAFEVVARKRVTLANEDCGFGYRSSRFKGPDRNRYIILAVVYRLAPGGAPAVRYPDVQRHLAERGVATPSLKEVRQAVIDIRRRKSMVLDPTDPNARSVGSFFMNPVVPDETCAAIQDRAARLKAPGADAMPRWAVPGGGVKLSAAWLIERAGFRRGYRKGNAGISDNHTLALVNRGGATAREVIGLAREIRDGVSAAFGVTLVPEPVFVNVSFDGASGERGSG